MGIESFSELVEFMINSKCSRKKVQEVKLVVYGGMESVVGI